MGLCAGSPEPRREGAIDQPCSIDSHKALTSVLKHECRVSRAVIPRERADRDVNEAIDYYLTENVPEAALGFIDAVEQAYGHMSRHPDAGSSRYAGELDVPGLRFGPLKKYPHLVFYLERSDHIDVWRVLHSQRDIPAWMRDPDLI